MSTGVYGEGWGYHNLGFAKILFQLLGLVPPYFICNYKIESGHGPWLYTQGGNHQLKVVMNRCDCWPNSIGVVQKVTVLPNCSFIKHARCVAPLVSNFKQQTHCDCRVFF